MEDFSDEKRQEMIQDIASFPDKLITLVERLSDDQKLWLYRTDGWTIAQVVHHCADSHINAYIRCKLCVTENTPTIKGYDEKEWALLPDANDMDLRASLYILDGIHYRWANLFLSASEHDYKKMVFHPQYRLKFSLEELLSQYAWHCNHHLAHIELAIKRNSN
jgi:hypothetical protein